MGGESSFWSALAWSLVRSGLLALIATLFADGLGNWLARQAGVRTWRGRVLWGLLLTPWLTPGLVIGYCYRDTAMAWLATSWRTELLYDFILLSQAVPVGVIMHRFAPRSRMAASALHCAQLQRPRQRIFDTWHLRLWWQARGQSLATVLAVLFLLIFQEAEVASLLQTHTWTEWMFTSQAKGLPVLVTLRYALIVVAAQSIAIVPVASWLASSDWRSRREAVAPSTNRGLPNWLAVGWLLFAFLLVTGIPLDQLLSGTQSGWGNLLHEPALGSELGDAALLAITTAGAVLFATRWGLSHRWPQWLMIALLLPGLLGGLPLGLGLAALFQTDILSMAYQGPVPLILGEVLLMFPRALLLVGLWQPARLSTGAHLAQLQAASPVQGQRDSGRELTWMLRGQHHWWCLWLVFYWAYFELMLPSLLAPPGFTPVSLVVYNFLHYGRIHALAAKLLLALLVPLGAMLLLTSMRRMWWPWFAPQTNQPEDARTP
ncbi:MAG: hypothetical protein KDA58_08060 [Planctomycetaceae bacterium]|nr:hypothetical protein [Planctomycetaceae bacterium]